MPLICYYRVSTQRQGDSRLGLEGQIAAVAKYAERTGDTILASFEEVESGKNHKNRPRLKDALQLCKATGATLVVAKLDRLARNVAFLSAMLEAGVEFIACDNPTANRLTVHILAAVAEAEANLRLMRHHRKHAVAFVDVRRKHLYLHAHALGDEF